MKLPKYLKCLQKVTIPSVLTLILCVSAALSYIASSRALLDFKLSFVALVIRGSVAGLSGGGSVGRTKCPGGGKYTHSVLEGFDLCRLIDSGYENYELILKSILKRKGRKY